ncbi:unnamed protein product, partial [Lactuca virosa]
DPKKEKCHLWEWIDEDEEVITKNKNKKDETHEHSSEVKIAILEHDFSVYKVKIDKESKGEFGS